MNRREFLFSAGAATMLSGCRSFDLFGAPDLRFGVVSDIHVTTPKSTQMFERALRYFKRRGVDAVMVPGDLTDWGVRSGFRYVKETWDRVFAGTDVVPLFCTGNHDYEGWFYGDMTMEMHANGYSEDDAIVKHDMKACWEAAFGEPFDIVRCRTVKGYDFVSCECYHNSASWLKRNAARFAGGKPFFYFQHLPLGGTTSDSPRRVDANSGALAAFPNCVAFTGHTHRPFIDERLVWQGAYTVVSTPSLSYACTPGGYDNGEGSREGDSRQTMAELPMRSDLRGGQGFVVSVWNDRLAIERVDLEEEDSDVPEWIVPVPTAGESGPLGFARRERTEPVPQFASGAELDLETRNAGTRVGKWAIVLNCEFPSAEMPSGHRVFDYEIRAVPEDGSAPLVKRFLSPAYAKMAKFEPARQRFWIDVAELPQDVNYVIEVRARNCFGAASAPLVSAVMRGKPGLDTVRR